MADKKL